MKQRFGVYENCVEIEWKQDNICITKSENRNNSLFDQKQSTVISALNGETISLCCLIESDENQCALSSKTKRIFIVKK